MSVLFGNVRLLDGVVNWIVGVSDEEIELNFLIELYAFVVVSDRVSDVVARKVFENFEARIAFVCVMCEENKFNFVWLQTL